MIYSIILFSQQNRNNGNIWDALGPMIIFAVIIFLRFFSEIMKGKAQKTKESELLLQIVKESREKTKTEKKRKRRPQKTADEDYELTLEDSSPARTALVKRLAPQRAGSRYEAESGTLDASSIVASSVEPAARTALESLTGIYDERPSASETSSSTAAFAGLYAMLAQPEGIRNAVVLSEIFKQKDFTGRQS